MAGLVCGHCGATNPAGSRFCSSCDGFLDWEGQPEAADTPAAAPPARPTTRPAADPYEPPARPAARPVPQPGTAPRSAAGAGDAFPDPARSRYQPTEELDVGAPAAVAADDGLLRCPNCGTANPAGRRFCRRCGEWVVAPGPPVEIRPTSWRARARGPWWKRYGPEKPAYTKSLTGTTVAFRTAGAIVAVVVASLLLGLFGFNPIGRARDFVQHMLGSGRLDGVTATAEPGDAVDDHPAEWAVDDIRGRAWTTRWIAPAAAGPDDACAGTLTPAVTNTLALTFRGPTDVREIGVEAGLAPGDKQRDTRYRPRTLHLLWDGGGCQSIRLADDAALQRFAVRQKGDVRGVKITVVGGYPPAAAGRPGGDRLDIGEITVWHR